MVLVAATARGVCAILLGDDGAALAAELRARFPQATLVVPHADFARVVAAVVQLVDDPARAERLGLPLDIRGTAFQRRVWQALRQIPPGETRSYGEIAARLGLPRGARAVAAACAANALAVAVPCHRVNGADGKLHGYRWGVERKRRLQARERQ
jgi:AraC family transcriptional regulator of adaptative response/methylated-DNA-[protein]-cysteine methyltransferase